MLKRIYIDNYKCFVNFTFELQARQLILGPNGSGKSTFLEVLRLMRRLVVEGHKTEQVFRRWNRTRWHNRTKQRFELAVELESDQFAYTVTIDELGDPPSLVVAEEGLSCNSRPLVNFKDGEVELFSGRYEHSVRYPFDWRRSVLSTISPTSGMDKVTLFLGWISRLYCLHLNPSRIPPVATGEDRFLLDDGSNFASWYRYMSQESTPRQIIDLQNRLADVIQGFDSFQLRDLGRQERALEAKFLAPTTGTSTGDRNTYGLDELSDGQRILAVLYSVLEFAAGRGVTLCIDEPDNFVALSEIQPWLLALEDQSDDQHAQIVLISHHPELVNMFASDRGVVFSRDESGPVRVAPYGPAEGGLPPSEIIARGWDRG